MLITGGSRGIGAAIARRAARNGWSVAINYVRSGDAADRLVGKIEADGGTAIALRADMASETDVVDMFAEVDRRFGRLDALINNAGINHMAAITALGPGDIDRVFAINVRGAFIAAREAVRRMQGQGGVIVNISSVSARTGGGPHGTVYAASKGAIDTFTLGLAKEVAPDGIRVCGLRPGMTRTEIFDNNIGLDTAEARAAANVPLGRMADADEIAALALWLCGPEASYVTGVNLDATGGL